MEVQLKVFKSDLERTARNWEVETSKYMNEKFDAFAAKLEEKHMNLVANLKEWNKEVVKVVNPNADPAVVENQGQPIFQNVMPPPSVAPLAGPWAGLGVATVLPQRPPLPVVSGITNIHAKKPSFRAMNQNQRQIVGSFSNRRRVEE